jgi:hypothetical protein
MFYVKLIHFYLVRDYSTITPISVKKTACVSVCVCEEWTFSLTVERKMFHEMHSAVL